MMMMTRKRLVGFMIRFSVSLSTRLQSGAGLIKPRLHRHHSELAVLDFAMRRHQPDKIDRMPGHRYIRMIATRHDHSIAVMDHTHKLRLISVRVDELHAKGGRGHIVIDI